MHGLDKLKFQVQKWKNARRNAAFAAAHPELIFPPDYMLFEAFQLDYQKYYEGGRKSAEWVLQHFAKHGSLAGKTVLDWGCGPARMVRHLPALLPDCSIYGTDYNPKTIAWCRAHIEGVHFNVNQLDPPTAYADAQFDLVYGISIFTHLSEARHRSWRDELMRISKPGALLLLTTHGPVFREKLTDAERQTFDRGALVVRGQVVEGHRVFAAFQPPAYWRQLFEGAAEILEHLEGGKKDWGLEQDVWILRKKPEN